MNYNEFVQAVRLLLEEDDTDTEFTTIIPRMIEYAELRIYREMDFISTETKATATLTPSSGNVTLPAAIIILRSMNVVTPVSADSADAGTRNPLRRVGYDFLDAFWPSSTSTSGLPSVPAYYGLLDNTSIRIAPAPDAAYIAEFVGTMRPAALSPANPTTYLSLNIPDLFLTAAMIFGGEYQQNAEMKARYEKQYTDQLLGVNIEAIRQKAASVSWSPYQPTPQANTQRDRSNAAA